MIYNIKWCRNPVAHVQRTRAVSADADTKKEPISVDGPGGDKINFRDYSILKSDLSNQ